MSNTANHRCVYVGCCNTNILNKEVSFFRFPVKDAKRAMEWQKNCGNSTIALMDVDSLSNKLVCEKHFSSSDFLVGKKRKLLKKEAIPMMFVEEIEKGKQITLFLITLSLSKSGLIDSVSAK